MLFGQCILASLHFLLHGDLFLKSLLGLFEDQIFKLLQLWPDDSLDILTQDGTTALGCLYVSAKHDAESSTVQIHCQLIIEAPSVLGACGEQMKVGGKLVVLREGSFHLEMRIIRFVNAQYLLNLLGNGNLSLVHVFLRCFLQLACLLQLER